MKIVGVLFRSPVEKDYETLAKVWEYSSRKNNSQCKVEIHEVEESNFKELEFGCQRNNFKLKKWYEIVKSSNENIIFMDVDTMVLKDLSHVFEKDFDICYTERENKKISEINGGVLFVKPNENSINFFKEWVKIDDLLLQDRNNFKKYVQKYGGQNQTSFGYLLENYSKNIKIEKVPCLIYNLCQEGWKDFSDETKVVHCKSILKVILTQEKSKRPKNIVRKYEKVINCWDNLNSIKKGV